MNCTRTSTVAAMAAEEILSSPDFMAKIRISLGAGRQELEGLRNPTGWDTTWSSSPRLVWPEKHYIQFTFYSLNTLIIFAIAGGFLPKVVFHQQQRHGLLIMTLSCMSFTLFYYQQKHCCYKRIMRTFLTSIRKQNCITYSFMENYLPFGFSFFFVLEPLWF